MKHLVDFPLQDGGKILVEVDDIDEDGMVRAGRAGDVAAGVVPSLEEALNALRPAAERIVTVLRGLGDPPSDIGIAFGIKLNAGVGAFIASTSAEANFTVTLEWKSLQAPSDPGLATGQSQPDRLHR
jgi:hypothetical protein